VLAVATKGDCTEWYRPLDMEPASVHHLIRLRRRRKAPKDPFECPSIRPGEEELTMIFIVDDACPKCRKPVQLATIELHPDRPGLAVHNYQCTDCGPVRARIISLEAGHAA